MKETGWSVAGYLALIILAVIISAAAYFRSSQATLAMTLRVSFQGEYKTADGEWTPIEKGKKISAMNGDVMLRGYFLTETPDGQVLGRISDDSTVALYLNHIGAEIFVNGKLQMMFSAEDPKLGADACGKQWVLYEYSGSDSDIVEIVLRNPHKFGNYNAVNDFLNSIYIKSGDSIDNLLRRQDNSSRIIGLSVIVVALAVLGVAVFSFLIKLPQSKVILLIGLMMLSAGGYYILNTPLSGLGEPVAFKTCALQCTMMLFVFFMMCFIAGYMYGKAKKAALIATAVSGFSIVPIFISTLVLGTALYDMNLCWIAVHLPICLLMLGCCIYSLIKADKEQKLLSATCILQLCAFFLDILATATGRWQGGRASETVFTVLFAAILIIVLKIIPSNYRAAAENKKMADELKNSRIDIMLSQIQPHFLHNTINVISDLCYENPEEACEALNDFSTYLRGNIDSLSSRRLVHFSSELMQIEAYLKLEKLRFGDRLNIVYDIQTDDFFVPTLTVQPLVENAVKHGICEKESGGTLTLRTRSEGDSIIIEIIDDGGGFDTENPPRPDDRHTHIGIPNVRTRLYQMADASLTIKSEPGRGTTVIINIPQKKSGKEVQLNVYSGC